MRKLRWVAWLNRTGRGFTLLELMVVVAILAVLMAIVMPAVSGTKEQSTEGQVKSDGDAVGKAVTNFNNKSIAPKFPEQTLAAHAAASGKYADVLTIGGGISGSNVNLYQDKVAFDNASVDTGSGTGPSGSTGFRACTAGSGDTPTCELLSASITKPGTTATVDKRTILDFFGKTDTYDSDGSVKKMTFVPDFLTKEPLSLPLKGDETKSLGTTANTVEEFVWVLVVNAPGSAQEGRTAQIYRLFEARCNLTGVGASTTSACDNLSSLSQVKQLSYVRIF